MMMLRTLVVAAIGLLSMFPCVARERYAVQGEPCDGYPRLAIETMRGMCAGLVAGPNTQDRGRELRLPRSLLQLDADTWLVTDLGSWDGRRGAVWVKQ